MRAKCALTMCWIHYLCYIMFYYVLLCYIMIVLLVNDRQDSKKKENANLRQIPRLQIQSFGAFDSLSLFVRNVRCRRLTQEYSPQPAERGKRAETKASMHMSVQPPREMLSSLLFLLAGNSAPLVTASTTVLFSQIEFPQFSH